MKKRILASFLSLVLVLSLVPASALAAEEPQQDVDSTVVTEAPTDPSDTGSTEPSGETPGEPPVEEPTEPEAPVCAQLEGCVDGAHDPECPLYVEPEKPAEEPEVPLTDLTPAEPVEEKPAAAEELEADAAPLADDGMSGSCGAEGNEDNVKWELTQSNDDPSNPTYTLTISGTGAMADYGDPTSSKENVVKAPWYAALTADQDELVPITKIVVESGVTGLGDFAFANTSIETATFSENVKEYGQKLFAKCSKLKTVDWDGYKPEKTSHEDITDVGTEKFVSDAMFDGCIALENSILDQHLYEKKLVLPRDIVGIGYSAFYDAEFATIDFQDDLKQVKYIGGYAFSKNSALSSLFVSKNITYYLRKGIASTFSNAQNLKTIQIEDGVTSIPAYFFDNSAVENLTIPSTVTKIAAGAFSRTNISSIELGPVTEIGANAFADCSKLEIVEIEGSESLDFNFNTAFNEYNNINIPLKSFVLKSAASISKVSRIGDTLESLTIGGVNIPNGFFADYTGNGQLVPHENLKTVTLLDGVISIGKAAFVSAKGMNTLTIADSVTSIGESAFYECRALTTVNVSKNSKLTEIGGYAFFRTDLLKLYLPSQISKIGEHALQHNKHLMAVDMTDIPSEIAYGNYAFGVQKEEGSTEIATRTYYVRSASAAEALTTGNIYSPNYSIIANTNGGTFAPDTEFTSGTLASPTKEGSIFEGWYTKNGADGDWRDKVTTPAAGQTYYAKWIELTATDITMEYGSTQTPPTIEGVSLTGWTSDNEEVVQIVNGELKAVGVGKATITADAALAPRSGETLTVSVEVTPKQIKVSMTDKTVTYNEQPHTIEAEAAEGGTLPADLELVYSYQESTAGDSAYIPVAPTHPGTYTVKVESGNPNYKLTGKTNATLTISEPQQEQDVSDQVAVTDPSLVYDGKAKVYTAAYEGITDWTIAYYDTEGTKLDSAPVNAGDYWVTINGDGTGVYASITKFFTIGKAAVTIRPNDKSAYVGDAVPVLGENDYTVTGLVGNDTLSTKPTLAYESAPDMSKTETYAIEASGADAGNNYTITYVDGTLTVTKRSAGGGSNSGSSGGDYIVSVDSDKHGTVTVSPKRADKGDTVTITVKPDKGYELDELTVTDKSGDTIKIKDKGNGKFTFTMPGSKVTVETSFKQIDAEPEIPAFADVPADAYYADAVAWAVRKGITTGTGANTFGPDLSCTRAQMVTFLWRANGSPKATGVNPFADVSADAYYYDAVLWAAEQGVTSGTSANTFSPDAVLTRAQTVTFLWRANGAPAVSGGSFGDVAPDDWYANAVAWAVSEGVTSGTGGNKFSPDAPCTRAQIVTFLYRDAQ